MTYNLSIICASFSYRYNIWMDLYIPMFANTLELSQTSFLCSKMNI